MKFKMQVCCVLALLGSFAYLNAQNDAKTEQNQQPTKKTANNEYIQRFLEIRDKFYDPANGYFSADGAPYHSVESLLVEAPDHGHESTSELYSYWIWLEVMYGRISQDWQPLASVWQKTEEHIIPSKEDQPTNMAYDPTSPAGYASEFPLPDSYPAPLEISVPVGEDPVSPDLTATYGPDIYGMHWLLDCDNFFGYGNRGDGVSTPSYINTFQRGEQESVYEVIPHPSWESFDWGAGEDGGFLPLFIEDSNYAEQWRYTNAPDADARAVQAMYWAIEYAKEQGATIDPSLLSKTVKMGDFTRLAMFDKYFKPIGVQSESAPGATGYDSAHYLMSWYYSWGGSADPSSAWAFRISSSHCHFGYQNPVAAFALSEVNELKPSSENGVRDFTTSYTRQMEFYRWLQSKEGGIAGGATNSWNGNYSQYPAGVSTFYDMAYDENPVYHDPGSGGWFGWQAWSVERVAEMYYINNDPLAKEIMDKWIPWALDNIILVGDNDFMMPAGLEWTGQPDTWNPSNPSDNSGLTVEVVSHNQDLGIAASTAKILIYYAAATEKYGTLHEASKNMAKEILDRMWDTYRDDKGLASVETRGDYKRIFEQEVYVPDGYSGILPNGKEVKPGVTFLDLHDGYRDDPDFNRLQAAYDAAGDGDMEFTMKYHRSWAQIEIALANAEYGYFFGPDASIDVAITSPEEGDTFDPGDAIAITATATDSEGSISEVEFFQNEISLGTDTSAPYTYNWTDVAAGEYELTAVATNTNGITKTSFGVNIVVGNSAPVASFTLDPTEGSAPLPITVDASDSSDVDNDPLTYVWDFGDGTTATGITASHTYTTAGNYTITLTVSDGEATSEATQTIEVTNIVREDIVLLHRNGSASNADGEMKPILRLQNIGTENIPYSELTIKYWFTHDTQENFGFNVDYAQIGGSNLTGSFIENTELLEDATYHLELGFTSGAGTLVAGADSGEMQLRLVNDPWANFDETNDFSFASSSAFAENTNITVYRNGRLIWGIEPTADNPLSTEEINTLDAFMIYPNPANDIVNIINDSNITATISLIDMAGKRLLTTEIIRSKSAQLNIGTIASGLYFVRIDNNKGQEKIEKIVIK